MERGRKKEEEDLTYGSRLDRLGSPAVTGIVRFDGGRTGGERESVCVCTVRVREDIKRLTIN